MLGLKLIHVSKKDPLQSTRIPAQIPPINPIPMTNTEAGIHFKVLIGPYMRRGSPSVIFIQIHLKFKQT